VLRAAIGAASLACAALLVACGGGGDGGGAGTLDHTLRYFPASTSAIAVLSTDLESEQYQELDRIVRSRTGRGVEDWLRKEIEEDEDVELSYDDDVQPLLGHEFAFGMGLEQDFIGAFRTADGDKLREIIERQQSLRERGEVEGARIYEDANTEDFVAVDGDTLVFSESEEALRRTLAERDQENRLSEAAFRRQLADLPDYALFQGYAKPEAAAFALANLAEVAQIPWFGALRSLGAAVSFRDRRTILDLAVNTDPKSLDASDLPFATGSEAPEVLEREREVVGGNRNQSLTTVFMFRVAEALFPDARFVRDVHALEREFSIDFENELLRQFNGPSASAVSLDGERFAARSRVSDPARLREQIRAVAPALPRVIQALAPLRSEGQALLFLLAPDALVLGQARRVRVIPPATPDGLYRVTGLTGEGPDELWFGVIGDVFVVASDEQSARRVADEPTVAVEGARGAAVTRVDLSRARQELQQRAGVDTGPLGELTAWVEASLERLRIRIAVEVK
jgi:hypothetical protein